MVDEYRSEGIPFLRSQNVELGSINLNDVRFIDAKLRRSLRSDSPDDGVFMSTILWTAEGTSRTSIAPEVSSSTVSPSSRNRCISG